MAADVHTVQSTFYCRVDYVCKMRCIYYLLFYLLALRLELCCLLELKCIGLFIFKCSSAYRVSVFLSVAAMKWFRSTPWDVFANHLAMAKSFMFYIKRKNHMLMVMQNKRFTLLCMCFFVTVGTGANFSHSKLPFNKVITVHYLGIWWLFSKYYTWLLF